MKYVLTFLICGVMGGAFAQNTVGLISYHVAKTYDGYNLIYPHNQPNVYLLDNCGEIVHTWTDADDRRPGNTAYLMPDGRLIKTSRAASLTGDPIRAGGAGESVEIRSWDNDLLWSFTLNDSTERLHHDIEPLEDGTILMIAWERKTRAEAIALGRDTSMLDEEIWPDMILQVDPETDDIIWSWHLWDHMIQDYDSTKANHGVIADHPELIDINIDDDANPDWFHANSIDYDAENQLILLSSPFFSEIMVIDHSTTTSEAASSTGGNSGRGGDLMWRWGNVANYDQGDSSDQQLFNQHDARWIDDPWLDRFDPLYGQISVFNNQVEPDISEANVILNTFDMYEWGYPIDEEQYLPMTFLETIRHPEPQRLWSTGLSSTQYLPNGNYLLCAGRTGYSCEISQDGEVVWEYITPLRAGAPAAQGDSLLINQNLTFRLQRFPVDYEAFDGRELSPQGWIEREPDSNYCDLLTSTIDLQEIPMSISPNPSDELVLLKWEAAEAVDISVYDISGHRVMTKLAMSGGACYMEVSDWPAGMYLVQIGHRTTQKLIVY